MKGEKSDSIFTTKFDKAYQWLCSQTKIIDTMCAMCALFLGAQLLQILLANSNEEPVTGNKTS